MKPPLERIADALEIVAAVYQRSAALSPPLRLRADDQLPVGFEPIEEEMPNDEQQPISVERPSQRRNRT